jgi:ankyrin repeat protein
MKRSFLFFIFILAAAGFAYAQTTDFFELVKTGTPKNVQAAIDKGADVKARGSDGFTPLMIAAQYSSNPEVIGVLLKAGADLKARDSAGATALMLAAGGNSTPTVIAKLCSSGADINARDLDGKTALMYAAERNENPAVIAVLVKAGSKLEAISTNRWTALGWAAAKNPKAEMISALLKAGADLGDIKNLDITVDPSVLMIAAKYTLNPEIILVLLKAGANGKARVMSARPGDPEADWTAFDFAKQNEWLKDTEAYWKLNDAQY